MKARPLRHAIQLWRVVVTLAVVAVAVFAGVKLWDYYMLAPWTRDGRVRADVVQIAPDVSGLVSDVLIRDNQAVKKGDILFRIDPRRFELAVQQAQATLQNAQATLQQANREMNRYNSLSDIAVSVEKKEQTVTAVQQDTAQYQQATVALDVARLNLARSEVHASVNGIVTNFEMRPGDYVSAGVGVAALIDADSIHVAGYFEETKLPRIRVGDPATVHLMGEDAEITGHVESITAGIVDRERAASANLLANVNPTFSWVRLAARVPVRIALDHVPPGIQLIAGRTATVTVHNNGAPPPKAPTS